MRKVVQCSTSTVQDWLNRWKQSTNLNDSDRTGRACATTSIQDQQIVSIAEQRDNRYKPRHHNRKRVEINERTIRRRGNKIQLAFVEGITHRKSSNESFKIGTRSQSSELEVSDLRRDQPFVQIASKECFGTLPAAEKVVGTVDCIQSKSMFGVASQVKASVASFLLKKIQIQNSCVILVSVVSCQQPANNLVMIERYGSCKKTLIENTHGNSQSTGRRIMEFRKFVGRQCHLILHSWKTPGNYSR